MEILDEDNGGKRIRVTRINGRKQEQAEFRLARDMAYRDVR